MGDYEQKAYLRERIKIQKNMNMSIWEEIYYKLNKNKLTHIEEEKYIRVGRR